MALIHFWRGTLQQFRSMTTDTNTLYCITDGPSKFYYQNTCYDVGGEHNYRVLSDSTTLQDKDWAVCKNNCILTLPKCKINSFVAASTTGSADSVTLVPAQGDVIINGSTTSQGVVIDRTYGQVCLLGTADGWIINRIYGGALSSSPTPTPVSGICVTATGIEGTYWWRQWSDGWLQQGGIYTPETRQQGWNTIMLPKSYANAYYTISGTIIYNISIPNAGGGFQVQNVTTSSFQCCCHDGGNDRFFTAPVTWHSMGLKG